MCVCVLRGLVVMRSLESWKIKSVGWLQLPWIKCSVWFHIPPTVLFIFNMLSFGDLINNTIMLNTRKTSSDNFKKVYFISRRIQNNLLIYFCTDFKLLLIMYQGFVLPYLLECCIISVGCLLDDRKRLTLLNRAYSKANRP